jgi:hypothetical protein
MPIDLSADARIPDQTTSVLRDAIRSDTEFPALEQEIESEGFWFVELGDYLQLDPNCRTTTKRSSAG